VLERHRVRCWVAPRDITPGTEWGAAIISGMDASKIMLVSPMVLCIRTNQPIETAASMRNSPGPEVAKAAPVRDRPNQSIGKAASMRNNPDPVAARAAPCRNSPDRAVTEPAPLRTRANQPIEKAVPVHHKICY